MSLITQEGIDASQYSAGDEVSVSQDRFVILESTLMAGTALATKGDPAYVGNLQGVIIGKTATDATDYVVLQTRGVFALSVTATDAEGNSACAYGDMLFLGGSDGSLTITKNPEGRRFGVFISNTTLSSGSTGVAAVAVGFENIVDFEEFVATTEALASDIAADPIGLSTLNGTASCDVTLADGANVGQTKMFRAITSIANPPTVDVATHESGTNQIFTFPVIGDSLILQWDGLQWVTMGGNVIDVDSETLVADGVASISIPGSISLLNANAATVLATLADGGTVGQRKTLRVTDISNQVNVDIATHELATNTVYEFAVVGDSLHLMWDGLQWVTTGGNAQLLTALTANGVAELYGHSTLNGTASCDITLADGLNTGDRRSFRAVTSIANPPIVTIATHELGASAVYTFATIGDSLDLMWDGLQWVTLGGNAQLIEALSSDTTALTFGLTTLDGTASCDVTLANGAVAGQRKIFRAITSIANPPTITVATHEMGVSRAVYTLTSIGDSVILEWDGLQWMHIAGTMPVETATAGAFTASPFYTTDINSNGGAVTVTLNDGTYFGQIKRFTCGVDGSTSSTVSVTLHAGSDPEIITFAAIDAAVALMWTGTEWATVSLMGATV